MPNFELVTKIAWPALLTHGYAVSRHLRKQLAELSMQDEDAPIPKLPEVRPPPTPRVETPRQIVATNWEDMAASPAAA